MQEYRISLANCCHHMLDVELRLDMAARTPFVDLAMAAWTPGSYKIREYARCVQQLSAHWLEGEVGLEGQSGDPLPITCVDKQTWRIASAAPEPRRMRVRYRVYANELTVRTNLVDDERAYWNGAPTFMRVLGREAERTQVVVTDVPEAWGVWTPLVALGDTNKPVFVASGYDELVDSPFLCGDTRSIAFTVEDVAHTLVVDGHGGFDMDRCAEALPKVVEAVCGFWGTVPYDSYLFMLLYDEAVGGGLEHLCSTVLGWKRFDVVDDQRWLDFLCLVSHELFHAWNGKRLRPRGLGPFDYSREVYTTGLWVVEGATSYYDELVVCRAGLMDSKTYLSRLAKVIDRVRQTPGANVRSLTQSSWDTWTTYYIRDEHFANRTVSYYDKGALVVWLLDLHLRATTGGKRSFDDVMHKLYAQFATAEEGYEAEDIEAAIADVAGSDVSELVAKLVCSTEPLEIEPYLVPFGLELAYDKDESVAYLGVQIAVVGGADQLATVFEGGPAWQAGLSGGDEVVAVDGYRVRAGQLADRLKLSAAGAEMQLTVFRRDRLLTLPVILGAQPAAELTLRICADSTAEQTALLEGWLGSLPGSAT